MMQGARVLIGAVSALALALSLAAHVTAVRGIDVEADYPQVWWLHPAAMVLGVAGILWALRLAGPKPRFRQIMAAIPIWANAAIIVALLYVLASFVGLIPMTGAGDPVVTGGKYYFNNHGIMREVSEAAFHAGRAANVRLFSAVWIYLCLISTLFLLFGARPHTR